jgi:hypothetical protein
MLVIKFENTVSEGKMLHYLRHTKKRFPHFSRCISEIKSGDGMSEYALADSNGKEVASCHFAINENEIIFTDFKGDEELKKMLQTHYVAEIGEWAVVAKDESLLFFDGTHFFLEDNGKYYKLANDRESLIEIGKSFLPRRFKNMGK